MVCGQITNIFFRSYYVDSTTFLSLNKMDSVLLGTAIPIHASGKQGEIETSSILTNPLAHWVLGELLALALWAWNWQE